MALGQGARLALLFSLLGMCKGLDLGWPSTVASLLAGRASAAAPAPDLDAAAALLQPELVASVYLRTARDSMGARATADEVAADSMPHATAQAADALPGSGNGPHAAAGPAAKLCSELPAGFARNTCVAAAGMLARGRAKALRSGAGAAGALEQRLNAHLVSRLLAFNKVVNGTNLTCSLAQATVHRLLGSGDGRGGELAGDVVGARALAKLQAFATGQLAASAPAEAAASTGSGSNATTITTSSSSSRSESRQGNSDLWALPRGTRVEPLVAACPPIQVGGGPTKGEDPAAPTFNGAANPAPYGTASRGAPPAPRRTAARHRRLLLAAELAV